MPTIDDFHARIREEVRQSRRLGKAVALACRTGNVEDFLQAVDTLTFAVDGWRYAMLSIGRLPPVTAEVQSAFLQVWIETKMLSLSVGHRPTLAKALRVLLPAGDSVPDPVRLYRGASALERRRRLYGFSWSKDAEVARGFAEHWQKSENGGVILQTDAPAAAVLHARAAEGYYDEGEVVVDPFKLGRVAVMERLPSTARSAAV